MWTSLVVKNPSAMRKTWVQPLGWEDPPGGGHGSPLQYCGLENPMGCKGHEVAKSRTRLSDGARLTASLYHTEQTVKTQSAAQGITLNTR